MACFVGGYIGAVHGFTSIDVYGDGRAMPCVAFCNEDGKRLDPSPTATPAFLATEGRHPALHIARLVAPHGAHRSAKRPRHIHFLDEARLHQEHHRICLGDSRKLQRALITAVFDAAGKGSAKACWAFMPRARADKFRSASSAAKPSSFQPDAS
jgi:hypothetical protein